MAEIKEKHDELLLSDEDITNCLDKIENVQDILDFYPYGLYKEIAKCQLDKADRYYEKYIAELLCGNEE